uniref:NADH-ubiquinone oxidoreductase chain 4 n=1 Tax=Orussus occidentalis TaxID=576952 RepID=C4NCF1_ORUOC|nr:NADH dehydrogenase subunit 4 [Orussus occidentalis]ACJ69702.1 NADH dehydrogenase subunit 4 [Orussus occidentalis]
MKFVLFMIGLMFLVYFVSLNYNYMFIQNMIFLLILIFIMSFNMSDLFYLGLFNGLMGMDEVSYGLIMLTMYIVALMILASSMLFLTNYYSNFFLLMLILLMLFLTMTFFSMSYIYFYFFFECSLIPTLILILGWGNQLERTQAGYYMIMYTLFSSLPLLLGLLNYNSMYGCMMMDMMGGISADITGLFNYLIFMMAFFVKLPLYMVHLWLPKAHVEAPISGSMILAGVMLKLGGYGMFRIVNSLTLLMIEYNWFFSLFSLMGSLIVSLMCLRQVDLKVLVAYSSVVHMGIMIGGLLSMSMTGMKGGYLMMISHGLCSSGMFCLVNIMYERSMSRSFFINSGMINLFPSMSLWWFLICSSNMSAPPSLNLLSELMMMMGLINLSVMFVYLLGFLLLLGVIYSLMLYSLTQHGQAYSMSFVYSGFYSSEFFLIIMHWLPLNLIILKVDLFV